MGTRKFEDKIAHGVGELERKGGNGKNKGSLARRRWVMRDALVV